MRICCYCFRPITGVGVSLRHEGNWRYFHSSWERRIYMSSLGLSSEIIDKAMSFRTYDTSKED